ncbi:MAG TPA: hypothetical protein VE912_08045, partial [Bacteroidales bacterium]|nr:hypothetical protein [Bacteroidales bacterium]
MTDQKKLNKDWLIRRTGDPFADVGGLVIKTLMRQRNTDDIIQLIKEVTILYVNDWNAKLNAFFLNSKITQPAFKGNKKITETLKYFNNLINDELPFEQGYCRILGEKTKLFIGGRDNHILSGSGKFVNFHHAFQEGIMLSKEAVIRMFFVPLGSIQLTDKIALLHSNNEDLSEFFIAENVNENLRLVASKIAKGPLPTNFKKPSSALFDFALRWIREAKKNSSDYTELNLYHFTNFGASPEIVLYNFSAALFTFYRLIQYRTMKYDWDKFTHSYFHYKKAKYLFETDTFELTEKKVITALKYDDFKTWRNTIYEKLLNGRSILNNILNWVRDQDHSLNFNIVKLYQINLRNMDEKTLQIIERIADYVLQDSSNIKKNVRNL